MNTLAELCFALAAVCYALLALQPHARVLRWLTGVEEVRQ